MPSVTGRLWRAIAPGVVESELSEKELAQSRDIMRNLTDASSPTAAAFLRAAPHLGHLLPDRLRAVLQEMRYSEVFADVRAGAFGLIRLR
jgi:hypothetical protein